MAELPNEREGLLERALTEIARRRELARAATPGPWTSTQVGLMGGRSGVVVSSTVTRRFVIADRDQEARLEDGHHIAANDPAHVLAVLDAAEATLRRHVPSTGSPFWPYDGKSCTYCGEASADPPPWPCPDAAAVLDLYAPKDPEASA